MLNDLRTLTMRESFENVNKLVRIFNSVDSKDIFALIECIRKISPDDIAGETKIIHDLEYVVASQREDLILSVKNKLRDNRLGVGW